jgi:2-oxoisovalerate dehydrogenase E1 component
VDAINHALHEEMEKNNRMVIFGQDIADPKGGVFTATKGLSTKFGKKRVFNSPLAESSIIGTAVGMAVTGYKPVVEIQFGDYIWTAMMQIRNEVSVMRYRSNNNWSASIVIRVPVGGYIHGALCHSQSIDGYFIHMPGIYIAYPSNARDAKGLLKMACRMKDPVIFMEHKGLYRQPYASTEEPGKNYILPFGKANYISKGDHITLICWGAMVQKSLDAIQNLNLNENIVEIIDLRTLNPIYYDMIKESITKTGKALVVYEDNITNGPGSEICSIIADKYFEYLDGPVRRVASKDSPVPYNWFLEENVLVQTEDIASAINELLEY